jgi:tRNA dimethylallyltransferase
MQQLIIILGPTATGKSDVAVKLAQKFNGEIVSADSRQVYKRMDIGTGKITEDEMHGVPHHLLDVVSPTTSYNVVKYQTAARRAIQDIAQRNKLPIVVGGTGFWIDAVISNQDFPNVQPNKALRAKLSSLPALQLFAKLQKIDPARAAGIADPQNPMRLIRAIEIALAPKSRRSRTKTTVLPYEPLYIGLNLPDEKLRARITTRLKNRLKQGMAHEAAALHANGLSWKRMESFGLEYRSMVQLLRDNIPLAEVERLLNLDIWHYAKRQRTWFKRNKAIHWIDASDKRKAAAIARTLTKDFLRT